MNEKLCESSRNVDIEKTQTFAQSLSRNVISMIEPMKVAPTLEERIKISFCGFLDIGGKKAVRPKTKRQEMKEGKKSMIKRVSLCRIYIPGQFFLLLSPFSVYLFSRCFLIFIFSLSFSSSVFFLSHIRKCFFLSPFSVSVFFSLFFYFFFSLPFLFFIRFSISYP